MVSSKSLTSASLINSQTEVTLHVLVIGIYVFKGERYFEEKIKHEMPGDFFLLKSKYTNYSHSETVL